MSRIRRMSRSEASASSIADSVISTLRCAADRPDVASAALIVSSRPGIAELARRQVDAQVDRHVRPGSAPGGRLRAGSVKHDAAQRHDEARLLGGLDEVGGRQPAASRVIPANERLHLDRRPRAQVEDRLVDDGELVALDRATQLRLEFEAGPGPVAHRRLVQDVSRLAGGLRRVHGHIRAGQDVLRVADVGIHHRDAQGWR